MRTFTDSLFVADLTLLSSYFNGYDEIRIIGT